MLQSLNIWIVAIFCTYCASSVMAILLPPITTIECYSNLHCDDNQQCCSIPAHPSNPWALDLVASRRAALGSEIRTLRQAGSCVEECTPGGCPHGQICFSNGCGHQCMEVLIAMCGPYLEEGQPCIETCGCASGLTCDFDSPPDFFTTSILPVGTCRP